MRLREILESASVGATASGSIAPVAAPLGMQSRNGGGFFSGVSTSDPTPNTPKSMKNKKSKFQNNL
ncbi:hypothetical protein UFOVP1146_270 [uncultured Caudovirales phage]|uniref:Uncharacterized protein n=1 Tax=uncultured Caudovirales phage TaxID=2100421 RepID=A0A6J5P8N5_9CAUD|nr:hypothetical protein UFOVP812_183 [uncultured Caudovirales phage]CAB4165846.1 hypothetical protein UFOVP818_382 [uncultured Caudovirales phage]CAB4186924.1 hypothetical protein UFOVP1146_270 [uncultured Caudovirales phage]CAB4221388.1 hypothetical protein UFOVP1638_295 [uncultured Caudovirales phage]